MEKECVLCGKTFETPTKIRLYCDDCLHHKKLRTSEIEGSRRNIGQILGPKVFEGNCDECGKPMKMWAYLVRTRNGKRFCSEKCYNRDQRRDDTCEVCGKNLAFLYTEENIDTAKFRFCSDECKDEYDRQLEKKRRDEGYYHICPNCGKEFGRKSGKFCSRECSQSYQKSHPDLYFNKKKPAKTANVRCRKCKQIFVSPVDSDGVPKQRLCGTCFAKEVELRKPPKNLVSTENSICANCKSATKDCTWLSSKYKTFPDDVVQLDGKIIYCPRCKW